MSLKTRQQTTVLYRFYDMHSVLLYIGISGNLTNRLEQHSRATEFLPDVREITLEHFDQRSDALQAERDAIRSEKPFYNVAHGGRPAGQPYSPNPTHVRNFDHGEMAEWPEYKKAVRALDALTHRLNRSLLKLGQAGWLGLVTEMASMLRFADLPRRRCGECQVHRKSLSWPYRVELLDEYLKAYYVCLHGITWGTTYSLDVPS